MSAVLLDRFCQHAEPIEGGCWIWTGSRAKGYGRFDVAGQRIQATRFAYETMVADIPADLELDHLCRVIACVNPTHLEPVTHHENVLRGNGIAAVNARKQTCVHGHSEWQPVPSRPGRRRCAVCNRAYGRRKATGTRH